MLTGTAVPKLVKFTKEVLIMKFSGKKWMTLLAGVLVFAALAAGCGGAKQSADKKS